jgi:MFS family permease
MSPMMVQQKYDADMVIINEAGIAGLIIAYIISWRVSVKQQWFWINSVIVFLVVFILALASIITNFDLLGWKVLRNICMAPGLIFGKNTKLYLITDVAIMLGVGSFLFFNKSIINFIGKGVKIDGKAGAKKGSVSSKAKK